jgi:hypothetical protein
MGLLEIVRTRTIKNPLTKVCTGEPGCKRPPLPRMALCRIHVLRKVRATAPLQRNILCAQSSETEQQR